MKSKAKLAIKQRGERRRQRLLVQQEQPKARRAPRSPGPWSFRVVIITHDRADDLRRLLSDIRAFSGNHTVSVAVYEDRSDDEKYAEVRELVSRAGWEYERSKERVGKKGFAEWFSGIATSQLRHSPNLYVFLPDDIRLCSRFFDRLVSMWSKTKRTGTLHLLMNKGRYGKPSWTGVLPQQEGMLIRTGWVDGLFACERGPLSVLKESPPEIEKSRWDKDPTISSGMGRHFSMLLHSKGLPMHCVAGSLAVHVGQQSKMNPVARKHNPAIALGYVDGERVHKAFLEREPLNVALASIPSREDSLAKVIESLLPQFDQIYVYLNKYRRVPKFLDHPRITVARSQKHGDRGDAGKFWWSGKVQGYLFTADDDIIYPPDYAATYVRAIEKYNRRAVVAVHGCVIHDHVRSYYKDRTIYGLGNDQTGDQRVHVVGTGCSAFHTSTLSVSPRDFATGIMADLHIAMVAKQQSVPMYVIGHSASWLKAIPQADTIYNRFRNNDYLQTVVAQRLVGSSGRIHIRARKTTAKTRSRPKVRRQGVRWWKQKIG